MEKEIKNKKKRSGFVVFLIIAVMMGFLAGISGEFFTRYYLSNLAFFRDLYFTERTGWGQQEIIIQDPRKVVVEQDLRAEQLKTQLQTNTVAIYKKKLISDSALNNVFLPTDYVGQAFILTSDGWLISSNESITAAGSQVAVGYNKKIHEIEKVIKDSFTGLVFIKITAQNLSAAKLATFEKIRDGQFVYAYNSYSNQLSSANIAEKRHKEIKTKFDFISSTRNLDKQILLTTDFAKGFENSPLLNLEGEIVAVLSAQDRAVPIYYISPIISQVLRGDEIKRPDLGINYIDLTRVYGLSEKERQGLEAGALISPDAKGVAVKADSPLAGKLRTGDIIISLENQKITRHKDLTDILLEYKIGQIITLKYLRDNQENELDVVL
ncbi:MAG TPA: serine protease [Candidatus Uhrbacteria bacterium]|nr:serine protease [Candidatus Uhrbacteria bacterium]